MGFVKHEKSIHCAVKPRIGTVLFSLWAVALLSRFAWVLWIKPTCYAPHDRAKCFVLGGDSIYYHWQGRLIANGKWYQDGIAWYLDGKLRDSAWRPPVFTSLLGFSSWFGRGGGERIFTGAVAACVVIVAIFFVYKTESNLKKIIGISACIITLFFWLAPGDLSLTAADYLSNTGPITTQRLFTALVGTLSVPLAGVIAFQMFGRKAGIAAAICVVIYPNQILNDTTLLIESISTTIILFVVFAGLQLHKDKNMKSALLFGVASLLAVLTRREIGFLVVLFGFYALLTE